MSGTSQAAKRVALKLTLKDPDYYRKIGSLGGKVRVSKGFGKDRKFASDMGALGGAKSRRD